MIDRIQVLNLSTRRTAQGFRAAVRENDLQALQVWLGQAIEAGELLALPAPVPAGYSAFAAVQQGGLWVRVYADDARPVLALVVSSRSRNAVPAWEGIQAAYPSQIRPGQERPRSPWVAVIELVDDAGHRARLVGLETALAWAWITKR